MDFVLGGTSAACAGELKLKLGLLFQVIDLLSIVLGFFSNPFDVIKTRQQLQGEMVAMKKGVKDLQLKKDLQRQPYKSIIQSIKSIVKAEGMMGLQKGLASALAFQFCMNSVRLGTYQTIDNLGWNRRRNGELHPGLCLFWGEKLIYLKRLF